MKYLLNIILSVAILLTLGACGESTDNTSMLAEAEEQAGHGNFADAVSICNKIATSADTARLSASDCCKMAMIYARAADNDVDQGNNMAEAARWLDHANDMAPDTVRAYFSKLPPEQMSIVNQLEQLNLTRGIDFTAIDNGHEEYFQENDSAPAHED